MLLATTISARSASTTLPAGGTLELKEDLVLSGGDQLVIEGTKEKPCAINGNGFSIKSGEKFSGSVKASWCTFKGLGKEPETKDGRLTKAFHAIDLTAGGSAQINIENCTFDACAAIAIAANEQAAIAFRNNTTLENGVFKIDKMPSLTETAISLGGSSKAKKFFQGNRVYRGSCGLAGDNWTVGGDKDEDGNIVIGLRGGLFTTGSGTVMRRNYIHCLLPVSQDYPWWSQVSTISPTGDCSDNVVRGGHWIVRGMSGADFHHNVVAEVHGHNHLQFGKGKVHHNIFATRSPFPDHFGDKPGFGGVSVINSIYKTDALEVYNNVLDCTDTVGMGVEIGPDAFVPSIRNNVLINAKVGVGHAAYGETTSQSAARPNRFAYADYNCFFGSTDNYNVAAEGKAERKDDGFAKHDLPVGGKVDEQCDPKFKSPFFKEFPFKDEDIKAGKVTVSEMLKAYRDAYTPAEGSPLLKAGDPADGEGTDIGAVQVSPVKPPASRPTTATAPAATTK